MMYSPTFSGSTDVLFFFPTVCLFVCLFVLSLIPLGQLRRTRSGAESYHNSNRITFKTLQNWRAYAEGITMMTTSPWPLAPPYTRDMHNYTVWMPAGVSSVEVRCFSLGQAMLPRCHALRAVYRTPRRHTYATASVLIGLVRVPPPPSAARPPPPVGPAAQLSTAAVYGQVRVDGVAVPDSGVSLNISGDSTTHTVSVTGAGGGAPTQTYAVRLAVAKVPPLAKLSVR